MNNTTHKFIRRSSAANPKQTAPSQTIGAELEKLDRHAGHDYLPMDVYVDLGTIRQHFQVSSIRNRSQQSRVYSAAA